MGYKLFSPTGKRLRFSLPPKRKDMISDRAQRDLELQQAHAMNTTVKTTILPPAAAQGIRPEKPNPSRR